MFERPIRLYRDALTGFWDLYYRGEGEIGHLHCHPPGECSSQRCDIHNRPKEFAKFPLQWRNDRKILEQVCKHGVGHPSPGEVDHSLKKGRRRSHLTHGCCPEWCCAEWREARD